MKDRIQKYADAVASVARENPKLVGTILLILVVNPASRCIHDVNPKAGRMFDQVAPLVVTDVVDELGSAPQSSADAASSSSSSSSCASTAAGCDACGGAGGQ